MIENNYKVIITFHPNDQHLPANTYQLGLLIPPEKHSLVLPIIIKRLSNITQEVLSTEIKKPEKIIATFKPEEL